MYLTDDATKVYLRTLATEVVVVTTNDVRKPNKCVGVTTSIDSRGGTVYCMASQTFQNT